MPPRRKNPKSPSIGCNICLPCKSYPGNTPVYEPTAACYKCLVENGELKQLPSINAYCATNGCDKIAQCVRDCSSGDAG